jgi:Kef-type K+ transport system membrane component KefB
MIEQLLALAVLLVFAKIFGELCERIGLPSILGELGAGIVLGPAAFGLIDPGNETFRLFSEIGIIMLLFVAGFEHVDIKSFLGNKKASITLSVVSSFVPLTGVVLWGMSMGYPLQTALLLGVALSATSMGITVRSLLDCDLLISKPGKTILGSLVINDITGLVLMTIIIGVVSSTSGNILMDSIFVMGGISVFFMIFVAAELVMPYLMAAAVRLRVEEAQFTLAFVVILFSAFLAEEFGLSTMIGAFFAGIALSRSSVLETETFSQKLSSVSYGLFIPIFFAITGAMIRLDNIAVAGGLALMMLCVITSLQMGSAFTVGKIFKFSNWKALLLGIGMLPYAEVTLIVMTALVGLANLQPEVFGGTAGVEGIQTLFSGVLLLIAMTIIITPIAMKFVGKKIKKESHLSGA